MKIKLGVAVIVLALAGVPLFAQQTAVITNIVGKVQLKAQGSDWVNATAGATVGTGTFVSTGFNSSAVLDLGTSQIQVKQLTRMRLDDLLRSGNNATTSLFLAVGQVHANVDNSAGLVQNFTLNSPVSTAAVRGTIFDFDGVHVVVERGVVQFFNQLLQSRSVAAGESSTLNGLSLPDAPADVNQQQSTVASETSSQGGGTGQINLNGPATTGSAFITVE